jgi:hypothetical protein
MRNLVFASVTMILGCGGAGATSSNAGPVDPAALDFCLAWANGVCRLAYLCVDTAAQDAAFRTRYGTGMDNCWQGLQKLCTSNQTGSQTFGPSCGPGKTVNQSSSKTCTDSLSSQSCVTWRAAQAGGCEDVCGAAGQADAGSGSDAQAGADTGAESDSATGSVATATDYCNTEGNLACDRSFECDSAGAAAQFGNLAGCKAFISSRCGLGNACPNGYNQSLGTACVAATRAATCQDLMKPRPAVCAMACQ